MRVLWMDGCVARGGAVALLTIGVALPARAQGGGSGTSAGAVRVPRGDTIVRVIDPTMRARMDSIHVLMRAIEGQPPTSEYSFKLRQEIDAMMASLQVMGPRATTRIFVQGQDGPPLIDMAHAAKGWIGMMTGGVPRQEEISPAGHFVRYFAHPAIVSVDRDSPAQMAGIVAGDSLVAYDGVDVVGRMLNLTQMLMPDRKLGITVRRAGENRDYQVTVARAPVTVVLRQLDPDDGMPPNDAVRFFKTPAGGFGGRIGAARVVDGQSTGGVVAVGGRGFLISKAGVFGASMETLEPVLAKSLDRPPGVLVKDVPEATVAAKAGFLPGDVIVAAGGQAVLTLSDVQMASVNRAENRTVTFKVIRDKKARVITVTWGGGAPPPPSP
jgi:serine protease Do